MFPPHSIDLTCIWPVVRSPNLVHHAVSCAFRPQEKQSPWIKTADVKGKKLYDDVKTVGWCKIFFIKVSWINAYFLMSTTFWTMTHVSFLSPSHPECADCWGESEVWTAPRKVIHHVCFLNTLQIPILFMEFLKMRDLHSDHAWLCIMHCACAVWSSQTLQTLLFIWIFSQASLHSGSHALLFLSPSGHRRHREDDEGPSEARGGLRAQDGQGRRVSQPVPAPCLGPAEEMPSAWPTVAQGVFTALLRVK